jgi:hypothetical protein
MLQEKMCYIGAVPCCRNDVSSVTSKATTHRIIQYVKLDASVAILSWYQNNTVVQIFAKEIKYDRWIPIQYLTPRRCHTYFGSRCFVFRLLYGTHMYIFSQRPWADEAC